MIRSIAIAGLLLVAACSQEAREAVIGNAAATSLYDVCLDFDGLASEVGAKLDALPVESLIADHRGDVIQYKKATSASVDHCSQTEDQGIHVLAMQGYIADLEGILGGLEGGEAWGLY